MEDHKSWIWTGIIIATIVSSLWHVRSNVILKRKFMSTLDSVSVKWIIYLSWFRTVQVFIMVACVMLVMHVYNSRLEETRKSLNQFMAAVTQRDELIRQRDEIIKKQTETIVKAQAALQPAKATPTPAKKAAPLSAIEDIYNPEKSKTDKQSDMDEIKKRYEDMFVIHMFLKKCGKIQPGDFDTIVRALTREMSAVDAPLKMQDDILSSADGSYKEIYAGSPCDGPGMNALLTQYNDYIKLLSKTFPPQ